MICSDISNRNPRSRSSCSNGGIRESGCSAKYFSEAFFEFSIICLTKAGLLLGYDFQSIINKYGELLNYVNGKQPNAAIFIQANLHVSKKRSDSDNYINNKNIDRLNSELSKFANGKNAFYMDANHLFDDKDGNLSSDKTADNAHLYAKYYSEWGKWICKETAKELKERQS